MDSIKNTFEWFAGYSSFILYSMVVLGLGVLALTVLYDTAQELRYRNK